MLGVLLVISVKLVPVPIFELPFLKDLFDLNRSSCLRIRDLTKSQHVVACQCPHELNEIIHFVVV